MALYSFKGHYPVEQIDNNKGWYEVPAKPEAPEGMEVRWENDEWIIRTPKPEDRPGFQWNWNHTDKAWVECEFPQTAPEVPEMVLEPTPVTASAVASDEFAITVDGNPV